MSVKTLTYRIHLTPETEGGYTVTVPALQGCVTWGRGYEQAVQMAQEAIQGFLAVLAKHNEQSGMTEGEFQEFL